MTKVFGELFPLAIGVAISPVPIIAVILMLGTARARATGLAFALGWVVGLSALFAIVLALSDSTGTDGAASTETGGWSQLVFGALFLVLALRQWKGRRKPGEPAELPGWMSAIDSFSVGKCFGLGALLSSLNPKNLALTVAAGTAVSTFGLSGGQQAGAVAVYVVISSITVAGPVLFFLFASDRAAAPLATTKQLMADNIAVIMTVLFVVLGAKMLGTGIAGLTA